ncbi:MAG: hypothetical protein NXH97_10915 [Rhodobacteraceae bacterium]|nr:hypothetical protein [Paracoccaceae bacterium]
MKSVYVSLRRLNEHKLQKTGRTLTSDGISLKDFYLILHARIQKETKSIVKQVIAAATIIVAVSGLSSSPLSGFGLSLTLIPELAPILLLSGSIMFFFVFLSFCGILVMFNYIHSLSPRLLRLGYDASALEAIYGESFGSLAGTYIYQQFLKPVPLVPVIATALLFGVIFFSLSPVLILAAMYVNLQVEVLFLADAPLFHKAFAIIGIACIVGSFLFLILFNIPISHKKNIDDIRWNFLFKRVGQGTHPQSKKWLDDDV